MATLVLTAVGTALGGPIGGAIGALIGQSVDREILFRPARREGPRLRELQVQTSSYGTDIAKVFGTMRVAGVVIWATDLIETSARSEGGKGQGSTTTYSYAASFAVALSSRPIASIGRIWADGNLLRGAAGDWKTATTFRWYAGAQDQAPDPLIAGAEGASRVPAHRGVAYAVFEGLALADFGNRIPSLTFEVIADPQPPTLASVVTELGEGMVTATGDATIDGFSAYGDTRSTLETIAELTGGWYAPDGDGIGYREHGPAARVIDDEGVVATQDGAAGTRRTRAIGAIDQLPLLITLAHYDPARDWQTSVQRAVRDGPGTRQEDVAIAVALSAARGKGIARSILSRRQAARTRRQVRLDLLSLGVAPGDMVRIADEPTAWRVTGVSIEAMAIALDLVAVTSPLLRLDADGGRPVPAPDRQIGETVLHATELPALDDTLLTQPRLTIVAAGTAPGWRRAAVRLSRDGGGWIDVGTTPGAATIGVLIAAVATGPVTLEDRGNALEVTLAHEAMHLVSADAVALDRGANLALIGDELIQFAQAQQIGARDWRLDRLQRGKFGTIPTDHPADDRFVVIEAAAALAVPIAGAGAGEVVQVFAREPAEAGEGAHVTASLSGASLLPPSPVALTARERADGGVDLTWRRRSRLGWRWRDGVEVPLGEEVERYAVTIAPIGQPERTEFVDVPHVGVAAIDRPARVSIRQVGTHGMTAGIARTI